MQRRFFEGIPNLKVISKNYTQLDKEMLEGIVNCLFGVVFLRDFSDSVDL